MKQILQNLQNGSTTVVHVPSPGTTPGQLLIATQRTLISAGTEKMLVEFGQAGWIGKARAQPEKVKQVLDKIKTDGLIPTLEAVFSKLGEPLPLGYCNAGVVIEVGGGVQGYQPGQRVVSNGPHAEIVSVPQLLTARIPDNVSDDQAAFTVLASIGLQGVRLAQPTLGETVVVYGLGLIGLITVQLLRANGCRVIGIDINPERLKLAQSFGAETINGRDCDNSPAVVMSLTQGRGADAVLITASAKTDQIMSDAAKMSRKRGRIILVGVVGLQLNRAEFYEKELTFQVSCSYGPGRYDATYEQQGQDYPLGFVRWTEQRNFEAILQMLSSGQLNFEPLITHRFPIDDAAKAYQTIQSDPACLGVLLEYPQEPDRRQTVNVTALKPAATKGTAGSPVIAIVGAGNFTRATLLPAFKGLPARFKYMVGRSNGATVQSAAAKFGIPHATTDLNVALNDPEVNLVCITTNHDSHAQLVCRCLAAGKHVFVEKPLALHRDQLANIREAIQQHPQLQLAVGFNRRFSPHIEHAKKLLTGRANPLAINMLVNAGDIPANHWVHDPAVGGGRIIGEGCHFIDLAVHLAGSPVTQVVAQQMGSQSVLANDKMSLSLQLADGSVVAITYFANGSKAFPKERITVFSDNRVIEIDNFRYTKSFGFGRDRTFKTSRQEKGHRQQFTALVERVAKGGDWLIPWSDLENVTIASFLAVESARTPVPFA
ncbi:MAG: bi-domain-containing oxidoreductase [Planctomycetaceae bacterium]|nr:bi-domain-containing oxidoreductase [Planctomycetaceae bacterium]